MLLIGAVLFPYVASASTSNIEIYNALSRELGYLDDILPLPPARPAVVPAAVQPRPAGRDFPCTVTAYYLPPKGSSARAMEGDETTATGRKVAPGTVAADRRYFTVSAKHPSRVYIPGYGFGETVDVGGAIKGPGRLDVWVGSGAEGRAAMKAWGKRRLICTELG